MRLLIISPGRLPLPSTKGGAVETLIDSLLNYNEQHDQHEIHVLSIWNANAEKKSNTYKYAKFLYVKENIFFSLASQHHFIPYRILNYFFSNKGMRILSQYKNLPDYDYIIIENELVNGYVFMKKKKGHYIFHTHNDISYKTRKKDLTFLESCDKVLSVSNYLAQKLREKSKLNNVKVVYNGIDTKLFTKDKYIKQALQKRNEYGIDQNDFVISFAGRLVEEKGIKILVDALSIIPDCYRIVLVIIGSSFFGKNFETDYIRKLKKSCINSKHRIIFTGFVEYSNIPVYYAMANIGCVPSLWDEPFGLVAIEQMSMELPIIATDSGALPEIVDSSCGYIFEKDNFLKDNIAMAIIELLEDTKLCRKMGKRARKIVEERFDKDIFCANLFSVLQLGEEK